MKKSEKIGAGVGAGTGVAATAGAGVALFAGKSAAVIAGTLGTIGGSMVGGILVCAAAPVVAAAGLGTAGYFIGKKIKNKKNGKH
jgi:hypothetical protein